MKKDNRKTDGMSEPTLMGGVCSIHIDAFKDIARDFKKFAKETEAVSFIVDDVVFSIRRVDDEIMNLLESLETEEI